MVWVNFKIVLHTPPDGIFYTNEIVTGSVVLEVKRERKIGQMYLKVKGTSKAMWSRSSPTMPFIKIYSEKKEIFNVIIDIFGELKGTTIRPGIISRQFNFFLPPDLPPSYVDSLAKVYYRIKIKNIKSYGLLKKYICPVNVGNRVSLNHLDEYKIPMLYEMTKKVGKSGHFSLLFKTYKGFTSRQIIPFEAIITNNPKIKVRKVEVSLVQKIDYVITAGFNYDEKTICKSVYSDVLNIVNQSCHFYMAIPEILPSTIHFNDGIVNISYLLRVKVSFLFYLPLQMDIPVAVGTAVEGADKDFHRISGF